MRLLLKIAGSLALLNSSVLFAANLNIPLAFEYIAMDGHEISSSVFRHKSDLKLSHGHHEIAIRYKDMVETEVSDTESTVKSNAFIISLEVDGDHDYSLKPTGGDRIKDPEQFAEAPDVVISRVDGGAVDYKVTLTDIDQKAFASRLYGMDSSQQPSTAAVTTSVTAVGAATTQPVAITEPTASSSALVSGEAGNAEAAQMLQHWWQRADEKTRKEFLSWAIKEL